MSVASNPSIWSKFESLLVEFEAQKPKKVSQPLQQGSPQPHIPNLPQLLNQPFEGGGGSSGDGQPQKGKGRGKVARTRQSKSGEKLCVRFNDKRGCSQKQCKFAHKCDIVLASTGDACMGNHKATEHNNKQHGQPKAQTN